MFISAIVVAAGLGKRFNSKISKALLRLDSKPLITYSLKVLNRHPKINEIVIVGNSGNLCALKAIVRKNSLRKVSDVILGGKERQDSVLNGLKSVNNKSGLVLIHDAVRPFINGSLLSGVIRSASKHKAAILGVPVKATIKKGSSSNCVERTIDRSSLWEVQTPQVFSKELLLKAYKKFGYLRVTDEAMLLEKLGIKVKIVLGSYSNIKITTVEDLIFAKGIVKRWKAA